MNNKKVKFSYCIHFDKLSQNSDIVFYFHGLGGDKHHWSKVARENKIYSHWQRTNTPIVVSVDLSPAHLDLLGRAALLVEENFGTLGRVISTNVFGPLNFYGTFIEEAIPFIRNRVHSLTRLEPQENHLFGVSLGGLNAIQLAAKDPEIFSRVVMACAGTDSIGPFPKLGNLVSEVIRAKREGRKPVEVIFKMLAMRGFFRSQSFYEETFAPFGLVKKFNDESPQTLFIYNSQDTRGLSANNKMFAEVARNQMGRNNFTSIEVPGGHCKNYEKNNGRDMSPIKIAARFLAGE